MCNGRCGSTVPHTQHLFLRNGIQVALRVSRDDAGRRMASAFMPDGTLIMRTMSAGNPLWALRRDVTAYLARG